MTENKKNIITMATAILIVVVIAIMAYVIKTQQDILNSLSESSKEQKLLRDNITRVESSLLSPADFDKRLAGLNLELGVIKDDLKKVNGKIDSVLISSAKTPGGKGSGLPSSGSYQNPEPVKPSICVNGECKDEFGYLSNIQDFKLNEPLTDKISVPFGSVQFNASKQNPWSYNIFPRTYSATFVLATDSAGKKRAYSKISITPQDGSNKSYDLPEVNLEYVEKYPEAQFFFWNPRVMVGFDLGVSTVPKPSLMPSAQLFIMSHGKTRLNSDWYILGLGAGYDIPSRSFAAVVTPFAYKVTTDSSIFQNINIGPSISVDTGAHVYGGVGLRFGL
jgi:hypothetical protein